MWQKGTLESIHMVQFMINILAENDERNGQHYEKYLCLPHAVWPQKFLKLEKYSDPNSLLIFDYRMSYEILQIVLGLNL